MKPCFIQRDELIRDRREPNYSRILFLFCQKYSFLSLLTLSLLVLGRKLFLKYFWTTYIYAINLMLWGVFNVNIIWYFLHNIFSSMFIKSVISFRMCSCMNLWSSLNHWPFHIMWRKDKYEPIIMVLLHVNWGWHRDWCFSLFLQLFHNKWGEPIQKNLINLFSATSHPGLSHHVNKRGPKQEN